LETCRRGKKELRHGKRILKVNPNKSKERKKSLKRGKKGVKVRWNKSCNKYKLPNLLVKVKASDQLDLSF